MPKIVSNFGNIFLLIIEITETKKQNAIILFRYKVKNYAFLSCKFIESMFSFNNL